MTGSRLRRTALVVPAALAGLALALTACGGAGVTTLSAPPTTDTSLTLALEHSPVGPILTTGGGDTLYDFVPDTPTRSACLNDGCVLQWPPLISSGPVRVGKGVDASLVGTLRRPDGSTQLSYGGHPLYLYNLDVAPGVVMGQAIDQDGGPWYVLNAQGKQITTPFGVTPANSQRLTRGAPQVAATSGVMRRLVLAVRASRRLVARRSWDPSDRSVSPDRHGRLGIFRARLGSAKGRSAFLWQSAHGLRTISHIRLRQRLHGLSRLSASGRTRPALEVPRRRRARLRHLSPYRSPRHEAQIKGSSVGRVKPERDIPSPGPTARRPVRPGRPTCTCPRPQVLKRNSTTSPSRMT